MQTCHRRNVKVTHRLEICLLNKEYIIEAPPHLTRQFYRDALGHKTKIQNKDSKI